MNLIDIFKTFDDNQKCIDYLEKKRWKDGVICPYCKSNKTCKHTEKNKIRNQCWNCKKSFSVTVGTIFHHTHIPLNKWFMVISLMLNAKKGLSAYQVSRDLNINRPTAWSMMHRIRKAMQTEQKDLLSGIVEMDECYIGGKPKKGDKKKDDDDNDINKRGRGTDKEAVVGIVERKGKINLLQATKEMLKGKNLLELVRKSVDCENSMLMTDEYSGYSKMYCVIQHRQVNHSKGEYSKEYSYEKRGEERQSFKCHTNTIEGFWGLLKRGIIGQFHKVSKEYLSYYLNEFEFRYNRRDIKANDVFEEMMWRMLRLG